MTSPLGMGRQDIKVSALGHALRTLISLTFWAWTVSLCACVFSPRSDRRTLLCHARLTVPQDLPGKRRYACTLGTCVSHPPPRLSCQTMEPVIGGHDEGEGEVRFTKLINVSLQ